MDIRQSYNTFVLSIMSGLMIGFGGIVFLMCTNRIVGATLFSFGLLTIICQGFALYTGRIGYFRTYGALSLLITIAGNFVGTFIMAKAFQLTRHTVDIVSVVTPKLQDSSLSVFLLSIGCGAMMYLAVDSYRKSKSWLFVILPIIIFILSGLEHSIANMFYISLADAWGWDALRITLIALVGNGVGSWIINASNFTLTEKTEN
ncbi:MAG: formate/nitrite transporter family protein [Alistipes sp.]|nr:formate/nitrite transporter family protein [Alistipes sp.]MBR5483770.1 formate/nitrite transporter family protein [Alistipes sp.]